MKTTFTLHQVDSTPLDDTDNPTMETLNACSSSGTGHEGTMTFQPGTTDSGYTFNPNSSNFTSRSWWQLCRIPDTAPGGRYILEVKNQDLSGGLDLTRGSNNFGIAATPSSPQRLCDARTDTTCPKVYANQSLSVRAAATGSTANFFLSDIGPEHKGKKVVITLWDPAEGGETIRIRRPTGTNTWVDQTFDWKATNDDPETNGTSGTGVTRSR